MVCPWTLARSWEHLSTSFSFLLFPFFPLPSCLGVPGCFRHSWEPLSSFLGVSLDACVVAGNTVVFSFFSLFSPYPSLPRAQFTYIQTRSLQQVLKRGLCNRFSMRFGFHRFLSPSFGVPFSSFFLFTHLFSCLFCHVSLSSCPGISFLHSFAHTVVRPLVCTCTTDFQPRFQVVQVFTVRWVFIGCPCALGSLSSQPHTHTHTCVLSCPLFMSSSVCPRCAHMCTFALTLVFCLPSGGRVCACTP